MDLHHLYRDTKPASYYIDQLALLVPTTGLEPVRVTPQDFKSRVSTKFHHVGVHSCRDHTRMSSC